MSTELLGIAASWPRVVATVEPDGGNLHVRIWGGPGWATGRGYPTGMIGLLVAGVESRGEVGPGREAGERLVRSGPACGGPGLLGPVGEGVLRRRCRIT